MTVNSSANGSPQRIASAHSYGEGAKTFHLGLARCCGATKGLWPDKGPRRCHRPAAKGFYTCERHVSQDPLPYEPHKFISRSSTESAPCGAIIYGPIKSIHKHHFTKQATTGPKPTAPDGNDFLYGMLMGLMRSVVVDDKEAVGATNYLHSFGRQEEYFAYCMGYLKAVNRKDLAEFAMTMAKKKGLFKRD
jgi:hypothetical protein